MNSMTIAVSTELDVITARMRVRDLARKIGMSTTDQARLAMATSSMAAHMGFGGTSDGGITIEPIQVDGRTGLQVMCYETGGHIHPPPPPAVLRDTRWMVDEVTVDQSPLQRVRVTLIKWLERRVD